MTRPLVLLHGWGMAPSIWKGVCERLPKARALLLPGYGDACAAGLRTLDDIVETLAAGWKEEVDLVGWSQGAQVAMRWATRYPDRVRRLVLLAATPRFVADEDWPYGVPTSMFRAFTTRLKRDADALLDHFCALQSQGERNPATIADALNGHRAAANQAALGDSLAALGVADLRQQLPRQQILLLHGANDAVTPLGAAQWLASHCAAAQLEIFPEAGHVLPLSRTAECAQRIETFIGQ